MKTKVICQNLELLINQILIFKLWNIRSKNIWDFYMWIIRDLVVYKD